MAKGLDYASSGVDISLEGAAVGALIGALTGSVRPSGTPGAPVHLPGGFGGLIEFKGDYLALATDGVGSKLQIASSLNQWYGVGIDCMAMNVNDLLCVGAEPIAFVDYIAVPKPDPIVHQALGASLAEACRRARVTLAGGETASLPGIVTELDLSGTALGWLAGGDEITGARLTAGDVLIGLPSSGIHSNGYSLVRKVLEKVNANLRAKTPFIIGDNGRIERSQEGEITLGEVLLNPTRIYCDPVVDLFQATKEGRPCDYSDLHAIIHITGGGLSNLLRLHETLGWHISSPMPVLEEFQWLAKEGEINAWEMHRTFNMGCGMVLAVSADKAEEILAWLDKRLPGCNIIGEVRDHGHRVTHVIAEVEYKEY